MKTSLIISTLTVALALIPGISSANSDDSKYPAANFQPKVIYIDKEAAQATAVVAATTNCPSQFVGEKSVYDPKFPAANFEPKVIYP